MSDTSDNALLVNLFWSRDERAVDICAGKFGVLFYKIAMNVTGNRETAEEVVNDTYLKLWNAIPPARPDSISAYGCRTAKNLAISRVRAERAARRPEVVCELDEAMPEELSADLQTEDLAKLIDRFLGTLKESERTIFVLRYFREDSSAAIALATGLTDAGVRSSLKRTREKLRRFLEKEGVSI